MADDESVLQRFNHVCQVNGWIPSFCLESDLRTNRWRATLTVSSNENEKIFTRTTGNWLNSKKGAKNSAASAFLKEQSTANTVFDVQKLCACSLHEANEVRKRNGLPPLANDKGVREAVLNARVKLIRDLLALDGETVSNTEIDLAQMLANGL